MTNKDMDSATGETAPPENNKTHSRTDEPASREVLKRKIEYRQRRKLKARREGERSPWFGLGMFGLVGWSVALPTLLGILIGSWIDMLLPGRVSWTLTMLILGLFVGCANAWYWIQRESNDAR